MKSFPRLLFLILLLLAAPTPALAQEQARLQDLVGIPVMEGLEEDLDARIVFDKAEGRIIHAILVGHEAKADVEAFYQETLFQLGWEQSDLTVASGLQFWREDERLTLIINEGDTLEVEIDLAPIS